ncbi:MAG TPA: sigma-70 family RNA polymerase sigma factor [Polyangiaceae bacterium]|nr:sigma-70 family RNA polymerase sigma factor [Polyangiaceae bacterium]
MTQTLESRVIPFSLRFGRSPESSTLSAARPEPSLRVDQRLENSVRNYLTHVWRVLRRSGLREADADDAAQDVFWILAQKLADVPEANERAFLTATALRVAADRRRLRWNRAATEPMDPEFASADALPDEAIDRERARRLLDRALLTLDSHERDVFVLFEIEQMSRTEIARVLAIPEGTVASRLRRARTQFEAAVRRIHASKLVRQP